MGALRKYTVIRANVNHHFKAKDLSDAFEWLKKEKDVPEEWTLYSGWIGEK